LKRWLISGGEVGECPEWYMLLRAARYLHIAPWELMKMPVVWRDMALTAESAEIEAENARLKRGYKSG